MKPTYLNYFFLLLCLAFAACKKDNQEPKFDENPLLVEAYLFAGEPIEHLYISEISNSQSTESTPISDASIKIKYNNVSYSFSPESGNQLSYAIQNPINLPIVENGLYQLEISYKGKMYSSNCTVPPSIDSIFVENNLILIPVTDPNQIVGTISWTPVPGYKYCIFMKSLDSGSEEIHFYNNPEIDLSDENPFFNIIEGESINLKAAYFEKYGEHELYITAINADYERYYQKSEGHTFQTAASNISNGWGIFTAFNGKKIQLTVQ